VREKVIIVSVVSHNRRAAEQLPAAPPDIETPAWVRFFSRFMPESRTRAGVLQSDPQPLPDRRAEAGLIQGVEM
jgi:hypothetical protein